MTLLEGNDDRLTRQLKTEDSTIFITTYCINRKFSGYFKTKSVKEIKKAKNMK